MTGDQPQPVVFDSIISIAIRLLRRYWLIAAAIIALITVLTLLMASRSSGINASQTLFVNQVAGVAERANAPTDVLDPRGVAIRLNSVPAFVEPVPGTVATAIGDGTARSLEIRVVGPDNQSVNDALNVTTALATDEITGTLIVQLETAVGAERLALDGLREDVGLLDEKIASSSGPEQQAAILSRAALTEELTVRGTDLASLEAFAATAADNLVEIGPVNSENSSTGPIVIVGGLIAGSVVAAGLFGLAAAAGRVRRRLHIERAAPATPVLGAVPGGKSLSDIDRTLGQRLISEHRTNVDADVIEWVGLGVEWDASATRQLGDDVVSAHDHHSSVSNGAHVLVEVAEGKVTEDQVSALRATLDAYGVSSISWLLSGVPRRDLSWANVASFLPQST